MATKSYSPPRSRATAIILIASALLLLAVAMKQSPSLTDSVRRAIAGAESTSPDGQDPCADFRTARDQWESSDGVLNNHVQQTFTNYAHEFASKGFRYTVGNEDAFISQMEEVCP